MNPEINNTVLKEKGKKTSGTEKQWILVSQKNNLFFRNLKKDMRTKYQTTMSYDKIVTKMIKCIDKKKFEEELKRID